jgi:RNA polymerase sigma-70 factor (ECF subfamily)
MHRLEQQALGQPQTVSLQADEDLVLVQAVLRRDRKATAEFVSRYSGHIYSYVRSRLAPRYEQVEDLVQEIFLSAWKSLRRYRASGSLHAWVMGIARHKVEDYYRERLRAPESIEDSELDVRLNDPPGSGTGPSTKEHAAGIVSSSGAIPSGIDMAVLGKGFSP